MTSNDPLQPYLETWLPALEEVLQNYVYTHIHPPELTRMAAYHMGWEGPGAGPQARGKRVRPLLTLLVAQAAGQAWQKALPAAAAVEFIHNFSLLHDDIQDRSPLRRGRPTVWRLWGRAQAINAGDALFALAFRALADLPRQNTPWPHPPVALLATACLRLTQGQYLDLAYEGRTDLGEDDYWPMIQGKTAALIEAAVALGAYAAGLAETQAQPYRQFGHALGVAFQVWDDYLGLWGDPQRTGKSAASDLMARKNSLPVLYGLAQGSSPFQRRWQDPAAISEAEAQRLAAQLDTMGARAYTRDQAARWTQRARQALDAAPARDAQAHAALQALAERLLHRDA